MQTQQPYAIAVRSTLIFPFVFDALVTVTGPLTGDAGKIDRDRPAPIRTHVRNGTRQRARLSGKHIAYHTLEMPAFTNVVDDLSIFATRETEHLRAPLPVPGIGFV